MSLGILRRARHRGVITVFALHNLAYGDPEFFTDVDVTIVPSRFAADFYWARLGLRCTVLPNLIDWDRIVVDRWEPKYVTFVNPTVPKGMLVFARIADELGRRRPDIRLLVVESRGSEATLAGCGMDLRTHGNVFLMGHTPDPRRFWRVTRIALMPSVIAETQGLVAVEAMVNGIPVIASDRGALPETLGRAGIVCPLPARLGPHVPLMPTAEDVAKWVNSIVRLNDDTITFDLYRRAASARARQWSPETAEPGCARLFQDIASGRLAYETETAPPTNGKAMERPLI